VTPMGWLLKGRRGSGPSMASVRLIGEGRGRAAAALVLPSQLSAGGKGDRR
jgi:hypothetical protein